MPGAEGSPAAGPASRQHAKASLADEPSLQLFAPYANPLHLALPAATALSFRALPSPNERRPPCPSAPSPRFSPSPGPGLVAAHTCNATPRLPRKVWFAGAGVARVSRCRPAERPSFGTQGTAQGRRRWHAGACGGARPPAGARRLGRTLPISHRNSNHAAAAGGPDGRLPRPGAFCPPGCGWLLGRAFAARKPLRPADATGARRRRRAWRPCCQPPPLTRGSRRRGVQAVGRSGQLDDPGLAVIDAVVG